MSSRRALGPADSVFFSLFKLFFFLAVFSAPLYFGGVYLWFFSASAVFLAIGLFFYQADVFSRSKPGVILSGLEPWAALYLAAYGVSFFFSKIPSVSAVETYKLAVYLLVFYAAFFFCKDREKTKMLCAGIALLGGVLSFTGLLQYAGGLPNHWWFIRGFLSGVYVNHNHFAGILELFLPVSLGYALAERDRAKKVLFIFLCVLMGTAFIFTLSRGGYVSLLAALAVMLVLLYQSKLLGTSRIVLIFLALLMAAAAFLFGLAPVADRMQSMSKITQGDLSFTDRLSIWKGAWGVILNNPWFGTGPGTFEVAFLRYRPAGFIGRPFFAHNDFLNLAADCGIPAFAALVLLFAVLLKKGLRALFYDDSRFRAGVGAGCLAAILALCVHSLIDFNFHIPGNGIWFSVIAGMLMSLSVDRTSAAAHRRLPLKIGILSALFFVFAGAWYYGWSDFYLWKARTAKGSSSAAALVYLDKSISINPFNDKAYYARGLTREKTQDVHGAESDFVRAAALNHFEPYYEYHKAKNLIALKKSGPGEAMSYYRTVLDKDPLDPKLCYLVAVELLKVRPAQDAVLKEMARSLFARAVQIESTYSDLSYEALWLNEGSPDTLQKFKAGVSADVSGILWFLKKNDQWKDYRPYLMQSLGIDPANKYHVIQSMPWQDVSAYEFKLSDFKESPRAPVLDSGCFYANGSVAKMVKLDRPVCRLVLTARGARAGKSYPFILVKLDGRVLDGLYIDSSCLTHFNSILEAAPGMHRLEFEYVNDFVGGAPPADRNLWIEKIEILYPGK